MLKHGILGLLNYGNMTGYEIMLVFRDSLSHFWNAQTSQIYRELQVLEKKGWIEAHHIEQIGKPDKNVFFITEEGNKELQRWLKDAYTPSSIRSSMLMKTFFRGECTIDENIAFFHEILDKEIVFPAGEGNTASASEQYSALIDDPLKALYWKFTIDFGVLYDQMIKTWCENCISKLEELKHENPVD